VGSGLERGRSHLQQANLFDGDSVFFRPFDEVQSGACRLFCMRDLSLPVSEAATPHGALAISCAGIAGGKSARAPRKSIVNLDQANPQPAVVDSSPRRGFFSLQCYAV